MLTCDSQKADQILFLNPKRKDTESYVTYKSDGHIIPASHLPEEIRRKVEHDLNVVLNLSCLMLVTNRRAVLMAYRRVISSTFKSRHVSKKQWENQYSYYTSGPGMNVEYMEFFWTSSEKSFLNPDSSILIQYLIPYMNVKAGNSVYSEFPASYIF